MALWSKIKVSKPVDKLLFLLKYLKAKNSFLVSLQVKLTLEWMMIIIFFDKNKRIPYKSIYFVPHVRLFQQVSQFSERLSSFTTAKGFPIALPTNYLLFHKNFPDQCVYYVKSWLFTFLALFLNLATKEVHILISIDIHSRSHNNSFKLDLDREKTLL